jgi:hypothetical protein
VGRVLVFLLLLLATSTNGFAQSIQLPRPVPSFNQAYTEGAGAWGLCPLGSGGCPDTIWMTGCLITAFASVLAYYDVQLTVPTDFSCTGRSRTGMDPGIVNDWLRSVGGYGRCADDPVGRCCLVWAKLPSQIEITTHVNRSAVGLNPVTSVVIDHALRQGHPVIAGVHWSAYCREGSGQTRDCHWVVITGKRGDTYTIIDPYNADFTSPQGVQTTLDAGVHGAYGIYRYIVVEPSSRDRPLWLVQSTPTRASYSPGDRLRLSLTLPEGLPPGQLFAQVTAPSGQILYAVSDPAASGQVRLSPTRDRLFALPAPAQTDWAFYDHTFGTGDAGVWRWRIWSEASGAAGTQQHLQTLTYEVMPTVAPSVLAMFGLALIVALATAAYLIALAAER